MTESAFSERSQYGATLEKMLFTDVVKRSQAPNIRVIFQPLRRNQRT